MTSYSSTQRFNTCPFAHSLHKEGLAKITTGAESNYMKWGNGMDAALTALYSGKDPYPAFDTAYPSDLDPKNKAWTVESGHKAIEAYTRYYQIIDKQWKILEVQHKDNKDKPTLIIDVIAKHLQTDSIYFWDHKCKKEMKRNLAKRYEMDAQITRYTEYVMNKFGDCAGGVVNFIVPGYRANPYYGRGEAKGTVEPAGFHFKFERSTAQRTPQQIDFWQRSQAEWEGLIRYCEKNQVFPKHLGYSCPGCEYFELCVSGDDPEVKESLYTLEPVGQQFEVVVEDELA